MEEKALAVYEFTPAVIAVDFEAMGARLDKRLEPYDGVTREAMLGVEPKEAKALRAELNAWKRELDDARKAVKREYMAAYNEFEAGIKALIARIDEPCQVIDAAIKEQEEAWREERAEVLEAAYREFCELNGCEALAASVPFDALLERSWLNKTTSEKKARNELETKCGSVLAGWNTLQKTELFDEAETEREFFATLSVEKALEHDAMARDAQERIDALRREREEAKAWQHPEQQAEQQPEPMPEPRFEEVFRYEGWLECTEARFEQLVGIFKAYGVHGRFARREAN